MQFINFRSLLYSDTLVPDIFINDYLPALKSEYVKLYVYCLFLVGKNRSPQPQDLARILDIPLDTIKTGLRCMENLNILSWTEDGVVLKDLKEIEINRFYRPKTTSTPEEASERGRLNVRRNQVIDAINNTFFSGVMSTNWYTDIDMWFDQYGFDEDVMLLLFGHCRDNGALSKAYVAKVAENMHSEGVKNSYDFDRYVGRYEEMKAVAGKIQKKLRLRRRLNEYQEEYVKKWVWKLGFSFDVIEIALRLTVEKPEAAFNYFDAVLSDWHKKGLDTAEKILAEQRRRSEGAAAGAAENGAGAGAEQRQAARRQGPRRQGQRSYSQGDFDQREYDDEALEKFVTNEFGYHKDKGAENGA